MTFHTTNLFFVVTSVQGAQKVTMTLLQEHLAVVNFTLSVSHFVPLSSDGAWLLMAPIWFRGHFNQIQIT